jgi:murein DD-endopeptidase MepM/ murein hydrolase activator NlpD
MIAALALAGCVGAQAPDVAVPRPPVTIAGPEPVLDGRAEQGGLLRGRGQPGATLTLDGRPVPMAADGSFMLGFDRDAGASALLVQRWTSPAGAAERGSETRIAVAPRAWRIERVDAPYRAGRTTAEFAAIRPGELARIAAARAVVTDAQGWRQAFRWPAIGRQSGWFGAQRVYQGLPGGYHSGADIALPTGAPVVAPADGVVVLAADAPFTLEGRLLLLDHGAGLSSAFLHLSRIDVAEGESVRQGQRIGAVGATGRVTGPHLHWGLQWRGAKLDPLLVAGPIPPR